MNDEPMKSEAVPMDEELPGTNPWDKVSRLLAGRPTRHPGSKVPLEQRVSRRRDAAKRAKQSRRRNRG